MPVYLIHFEERFKHAGLGGTTEPYHQYSILRAIASLGNAGTFRGPAPLYGATMREYSTTLEAYFPFTIYVLADPLEPDNWRYVGVTHIGISWRLGGHLYEARKYPHTHRSHWINKLLGQGRQPVIFAVECCSNPHEAERRWIAMLREEGYQLINGTAGGRGSLGGSWKLTERQREDIRKRLIQHYMNKHGHIPKRVQIRIRSIAAKMAREWPHPVELPQPPQLPRTPSYGHRGHKHSEATKQAWSELRRGKTWVPAETYAAIADKNRGAKRTAEQRERISQGLRDSWARRKKGGGDD